MHQNRQAAALLFDGAESLQRRAGRGRLAPVFAGRAFERTLHHAKGLSCERVLRREGSRHAHAQTMVARQVGDFEFDCNPGRGRGDGEFPAHRTGDGVGVTALAVAIITHRQPQRAFDLDFHGQRRAMRDLEFAALVAAPDAFVFGRG